MNTGGNTTGNRTVMRIVKAMDVVMVAIPFIMCWYAFYADTIYSPYYRKGNWLIVALYVVLYYMVCRLYSGFLIQTKRIAELVYCQTLTLIITDGLFYIIIWLLNKFLPAIQPYLMMAVAQMGMIFLWSYIAHHWYKGKFPASRTVIVWDERPGMDELVRQYGMDGNFDIIGSYYITDCLEGNMACLNDAEVVFLCDLHSHARNQIIKYCVEKGITAYNVPRIGDVIMSGATKMHLFHLPILMVQRYNPTPEYLIIKRATDIVLSALALILLSPVFLIVSIIIKATDGGTVFYRQCRLTVNGKTFDVLKFRSMRMDAEKDGVARLSTGEHDDRITPIGHFIRAVRIDELPQLINILKGDMTIVGPRPERPEIAEQYEKELPEFKLRLQVKAGLTGYAQVYGKYNTTPYDKLLMDLMYIAKPSMAEDIKIILATIRILFLPESTEGIAEGQTTAGSTEVSDPMNCEGEDAGK